MEEQDTQTVAPPVESAPTEGNAGAAQSSQGTAVQAPVAEVKADTTDSSAQSKYLGKKYSDISAYDKAHNELLSERQPLAEKANLADKLVERLAKETGQSPETVVEYLRNIDSQTTPTQAQAGMDPAIKQELVTTRMEIAKIKEDKILDDLISAKPHLADARADIRASWIINNEPLDSVAARYEKLVAAGRSEKVADQAAKQQDQVSTGKGAGEPQTTRSSEGKFSKAVDTGRLEDFAAALPDNLSLKR